MPSENDVNPDGAVAKAAAPLSLAVVAAAVWTNLPELALINLELWSTVAIAAWALAAVLHLGSTGLWIFGVALGLPALWLTGQTLRLAIRASRTTEAWSDGSGGAGPDELTG